jgi:circadian clock protein KaiC
MVTKRRTGSTVAAQKVPQGSEPIERVTTGIEGLDLVLGGGLPKGGISIVQGTPGAGKTILGNQLCFHHVANGGRALYVTLLAENHARMLQHMGQLSFFNTSVVPDRLYYISAFRTLEEHGLKGLLDLLRREVLNRDATLLILDGLIAVEESAATARDFKKFIHELQAQATLSDCTMLLLTGAPSKPISPEHTMVDGVLELRSELYGRRAERDLQVHKMRGIDVIRGRHTVRIDSSGMLVFPRLEGLLAHPTADGGVSGASRSTGLKELDRMTGGGLPRGSTTLLIGPAGSGKTTLGLHMLTQCSVEEPGLLFGFYETPAALEVKAAAIKLPLRKLIKSGAVEVIWQPTTEAMIDEIGHRLLAAVRRRGVMRLVVDGLGGFERLAPDRSRLDAILSAFNNEFFNLGTTTLYIAEAEVSGGIKGVPLDGLVLKGVSPVAQNILLMRYVELRSTLYRMLSVLKVRDQQIDPQLHVYEMTSSGVRLDADASRAESILAEANGR